MSPSDSHRTVTLVILDGWGLAPPGEGNAIDLAATPTMDRIWREYPHTTLKTSGIDVGLPAGQMGNSEVGHLNLGAGFVVYQSITRIDVAIEQGELATNPELLHAMHRARDTGKTLHLMGLVSDGGVHSHIRHLLALIGLARTQGVKRLAVHAFLDGRDTSPTGGAGYLRQVQDALIGEPDYRIASVIGRYYAMDRDRRWQRTREAFDLLVSGAGEVVVDPVAAVEALYAAGTTDEFMVPLSVHPVGVAPTVIEPGDSVVFFNFRADRTRQLTQMFLGPVIEGEPVVVPADLDFVMMTEYADYLHGAIAFPAIEVVEPLAKVIADAGLRQFHTAETEKYAHVTYFFNGGREDPFSGEERALVPSPKVATYDLQPEMSAAGIADAACAALASGQYAFVIINFANCDMVGHTGVLSAAVAATEAVDRALARVLAAALAQGGAVLVTADHGNAEQMYVPGTHAPMTAHTTNEVPLVLVAPLGDPARHAALRDGSRLADVAPTVLELLGVPKPSEMTGQSLLQPAAKHVTA